MPPAAGAKLEMVGKKAPVVPPLELAAALEEDEEAVEPEEDAAPLPEVEEEEPSVPLELVALAWAPLPEAVALEGPPELEVPLPLEEEAVLPVAVDPAAEVVPELAVWEALAMKRSMGGW
jgi:hypothetical protein